MKPLSNIANFCHPNMTIITKNGIKKIENVNVDDYILTQTGNFKKVLKVLKTEFDGELIKIKNIFGNDIIITKQHFVLSKLYSKLTTLTQLKKWKMLVKEINLVNAENIVKFNMLYSTLYLDEEQYDDIKYEKEFFELLGMYLGDGNISVRYSKNKNIKSARIRFSLGKNYPELIDRCKELLHKYSNNKVSEYWYDSYVILTCYDTNLAKIIGGLCGFANNKSITWKILSSPIELQKSIIRGWYETDGCDTRNGFMIYTAEENLMNEMTFILKRLNIIYSITKKPPKTICIKGKLSNTKGGYSIDMSNININNMLQIRTTHSGIFEDNYLINRLNAAPEKIEYKGNIYSLKIDGGNSYTVNGIAISNK